MSISQPAVGRNGVCVSGRSAEPTVSSELLVEAISSDEVEAFRPLLPVGYAAGVQAYQAAAARLTPSDLTQHYTAGLDFFHDEFLPQLKHRLESLTNGVWSLDDYVAFAAGSDVDLMTHLINSVAASKQVTLFPGDWYGFLVGCSNRKRIKWDVSGEGSLACLCIPSVRNGHITPTMLEFLERSGACLLNLNLFPTLASPDRETLARELLPVLPKSVLSISFSRGFGLTVSQLGVILVPRSHPFCQEFAQQLNWFTYFYNAIAADAFLQFSLEEAQSVDNLRRQWVHEELERRGLPSVKTGSYYVKSFQVAEKLPEYLEPLQREGVVRLCFKPPQS